MISECATFDRKSIRYVIGKSEDTDSLACDCVAFANAQGGTIIIGVEDDKESPPAGQRISNDLAEHLKKRISQITVNVSTKAGKCTCDNGGEYVEITVFPNQQSIAATSDGRYFIRVADETRRLLPDDLGRLMTEKANYIWELQTHRHVLRENYGPQKLDAFLTQIRASDRISSFVKSKSGQEMLSYYFFAKDQYLTNLGILWVGRREDRGSLLYAPIVQCIKFDESERKIRKQTWDDYQLNPIELIEAIWDEVPDWRESYELPDGLFRKSVPHYDEIVIRELLANALVHRPYTQRAIYSLTCIPTGSKFIIPAFCRLALRPGIYCMRQLNGTRILLRFFMI
jgi:ATP-dependent DNA helicase RecG